MWQFCWSPDLPEEELWLWWFCWSPDMQQEENCDHDDFVVVQSCNEKNCDRDDFVGVQSCNKKNCDCGNFVCVPSCNKKNCDCDNFVGVLCCNKKNCDCDDFVSALSCNKKKIANNRCIYSIHTTRRISSAKSKGTWAQHYLLGPHTPDVWVHPNDPTWGHTLVHVINTCYKSIYYSIPFALASQIPTSLQDVLLQL